MDGLRNPQVPFVAPKAPPTPPTGPPKPGTPGWKQFTEDRWHANHPVQPAAPKVLTPTDQAMGAFRTALAQVNAATPQVDSAAIYAPYRASEAVTGQLGTGPGGYQQAMQTSGDAASQQYTAGLNDAQKAAAAFGISAGAGANPTQLNNSGTAPIAAQTQAGSASAAAATAQWQALLERTAGAKVADATIARDQGLTAAKQSLATSLPGVIGNFEDRAFQNKAQDQNMALAYTQLDAKQKADLMAAGIDMKKLQQQGTQFDVTAWLKQRDQNITKSHNKVTEGQGADRVAQGWAGITIKQQAAQKKAQAQGIKGIGALNAALKPTSTSGTKPIVGYRVTVVADPNGVNAGAPNQVLPVKDPNSFTPPAGWTIPKGTAPVAIYGQAGAGTSPSLTLARWNQLFNQFKAANRGLGFSDAVLMQSMPPRPKK